MIKYILFGIILCYLFFILYCKIYYRFWSIQPVFHIHNLKYWIFPPGIIQQKLPKLTKFYDPLVEFYNFNQMPDEKKEQLFNLNRKHYLHQIGTNYNPTKDSILQYFNGHNKNCYVSIITKKKTLMNYKQKKVMYSDECIATMTTRPLLMFLRGEKLDIGYVDYLCVAKKHRKKGIAPKIIYTHYVRHRQNDNMNIFLFKREGKTTFITPLTVYKTYGFDIKNWKKPPMPHLPVLITESNFQLFWHYISSIKDNFSCFIIPSLSHIKNLVNHKLIYIFLILENNSPYGCYIFRNPYTTYENGNKSVDCIASYCSDENKMDNFISKFYFCLLQINYPFQYLLVENISYNNYIIKNILQNYSPFLKSTTSYYFYNFGNRPFVSNNVFILN